MAKYKVREGHDCALDEATKGCRRKAQRWTGTSFFKYHWGLTYISSVLYFYPYCALCCVREMNRYVNTQHFACDIHEVIAHVGLSMDSGEFS
jgi:hypothetical protein